MNIQDFLRKDDKIRHVKHLKENDECQYYIKRDFISDLIDIEYDEFDEGQEYILSSIKAKQNCYLLMFVEVYPNTNDFKYTVYTVLKS